MSDGEDYFAKWGQGDVSLDVNALPHVNADDEIVDIEVAGIVIISQTCDIVNGVSAPGSPALIQVAGLVKQDPRFLEEVKKFRRPRYMHIPALSDKHLVGDLELVATYDRAVLERWERLPAPTDLQSRSHCSFALGRHRSRHAFPDSWAPAFGKLRDWIKARAGKGSDEGLFVSALEEIRVAGDDAEQPASIDIICIIPATATPAERVAWLATMCPAIHKKIASSFCPDVTVRLATTRELSAEEYLASRPLDFDAMSRAANDDDAPQKSDAPDITIGKSQTKPEA